MKCPKCEAPLKIPAGQKKKSKSESDPFGEDFLSDLDLSRAEDRSQRVCPRCGAALRDDAIECGACGADLSSGGGAIAGGGGGSPVGRKKRTVTNKGEFYRGMWGDAWRFLMKNKGYAIKSSMLLVLLVLLDCAFGFMLWYCVNIPPQMFWLLLTFVFAMAPIGWVWHLVTETINHSLKKKDVLKRVNFDFFTNVAFGIKFFCWQLVAAFPFVIAFGAGGGMMIKNGSIVPGAILIAIGELLVFSMLPVGMTHMAMPQQLNGWMIHKVLPGWGKSLGAIAYWLLFLVITSLPVLGCLGAIPATSQSKLNQFARVMNTNDQIYVAREKAAEHERKGSKDQLDPGIQGRAGAEVAAIPWNALTVPGILLACGLIMSGPVIVLNARVVGQIAYYFSPDWDLNTLEKQLKYTAKEVKYDKHGQPIDPNKKPAWMTAVIALVVIIVLFFVGNFIAYQLAGKTFPSGMFGE
ncbi:MAG: zinc ribbon domain-containing protein [Planctomycetaceae bacterium]|nr:zinc ribbon domain-containing protein [Planctomycetaceae bacterium]